MLKKVLLLFCFSIYVIGADIVPEVRLPMLERAPKIDGIIGEEEWIGSTEFSGLGDPIDAREGYVWFGYDKENLYFCFKTELPPDGELITNVKRDGGGVVGDDSIELWIVPPDEGREVDGPKGKGFFQIIINSIGVIFGRHHEPGYGLPASDWKPSFSWASKTDNRFWYMEICIPLKDFGMREIVFPSEWKLRFVRNWKNPGRQAAIPQSADFYDKGSMARIIFDNKVPSIGTEFSTGLLKGDTDVLVKIFNPDINRTNIEITIKVLKGDKEVISKQEEIELLEKGEKVIKVPLKFEISEKNELLIDAKDKRTEKVLYYRRVSFGSYPDKVWTLPEGDLTFRLSFDQETLIPEKAAGKKDPIKAEGDYSFIEGVKGKAIYFKEKGTVIYDNKDNLQVPGCVSFWIKLLRDRYPGAAGSGHPYSYTYFWWTQFKPTGYIGIQDSVYGQLLFWFSYFPGIRNGLAGGGFPWEKDRWFHICANIDKTGVELFLDGKKIGQAVFERELTGEELSPFIIGGTELAIDELQIFSRTLTPPEIEKLALGKKTMDGKICWFPSINSLVVEGILEPGMVKGSSLELVVTDEEGKKEIYRQKIGEEELVMTEAGTLRLRKIVSLPELSEGTYKTYLQEIKGGKKGKEYLLRDFIVKHYIWENNNLGKSDVIIPPFTAIKVSDNTISCILRDYKLGILGLPEQIVSLNKDILSRPISLSVIAGGKSIKWEKTAKVTFNDIKGNIVKFQSQASNEIMDINSTGEFEYDGLMTIKLHIKPKKGIKPVDRIFLDIPVKGEIAKLYHAVGEHIRANPADVVPEKEGVVFESRSIPQPNIDNFIPYIWTGEEQRGICWVSDWDKDWIHSKERSAIELIREKGEVIIRVNLINGPVELTREREIEFGLMASPVKPMPEGWRDKVFNFDWPGRGLYTILWTAEAGFHYGWASRYPLDEDWTYIDKLAETQRTGVIDYEFIDKWVKKVMEHPGQISDRDSEENVRRHVLFAFNRAQNFFKIKDGKLIPYSCATESTDLLPENKVYGDEWQYRGGMHSTKSFRDYAIWYAAKMIEHGMGGIYVDNTFASAKYTWPIGEGYIGDDGEIHPNLGTLSRTRQLIKGLATMMYEKGKEPFVYVHMTNANILPMLSFAQANVGWEWKYGKADFQDKFTPGYIRAVNIGQQAGTIPVVLGGVVGIEDKQENIRVSRTCLAMTLPHQIFVKVHIDGAPAVKARDIILEFVVRPNCETYFYWDNKDLLEVPENLMATFHKAGDEILLVIGNLKDEGKYEMKFNLNKLRFSGIQEVVNAETGEKIDFNGNSIYLNIPKHDFALIKLKMMP